MFDLCLSYSLPFILSAYFRLLSSSSFRVVISDPSSHGLLQPLEKKSKINLYFFSAVIKNIKHLEKKKASIASLSFLVFLFFFFADSQ